MERDAGRCELLNQLDVRVVLSVVPFLEYVVLQTDQSGATMQHDRDLPLVLRDTKLRQRVHVDGDRSQHRVGITQIIVRHHEVEHDLVFDIRIR